MAISTLLIPHTEELSINRISILEPPQLQSARIIIDAYSKMFLKGLSQISFLVCQILIFFHFCRLLAMVKMCLPTRTLESYVTERFVCNRDTGITRDFATLNPTCVTAPPIWRVKTAI